MSMPLPGHTVSRVIKFSSYLFVLLSIHPCIHQLLYMPLQCLWHDSVTLISTLLIIIIHPTFCSSFTKFMNTIFWKRMNQDCKLAQVVHGARAWNGSGQGHKRPKIDLEGWQRRSLSYWVKLLLYKLPFSFVRGQASTMRDIVWVSPQGHVTMLNLNYTGFLEISTHTKLTLCCQKKEE